MYVCMYHDGPEGVVVDVVDVGYGGEGRGHTGECIHIFITLDYTVCVHYIIINVCMCVYILVCLSVCLSVYVCMRIYMRVFIYLSFLRSSSSL